MNAIDTRMLLHEFRSFIYTKVLVIDITGSIFSPSNRFLGYLATKDELDYVVEHWSENNYDSPSSTLRKGSGEENNTERRLKRSTEGPTPLEEMVQQKPSAAKMNSHHLREGPEPQSAPSQNALNQKESEIKPQKKDRKLSLGDPKPQNFLVLTVLTDKFKAFHAQALSVEFQEHYKLSHSGVMEPYAVESISPTDELESGSPSVKSEQPFKIVQKRPQMKRSKNIVTNNEPVHEAVSSSTNIGDKWSDAIDKLPIFASLTTSINESIQRLLVYLQRRNCSISPEYSGFSSTECVNALTCSAVADRNEQLFCNYLCDTVIIVVQKMEQNQKTNPVDSVSVNRRFATRSDLVEAAASVCRQQSELSLRNESSGVIQMQFSENVIYFYNENVASRNSEIVQRHKQKPMPNQNQQPHYPAKNYSDPIAAAASHSLFKRNVSRFPTTTPPKNNGTVGGNALVDERYIDGLDMEVKAEQDHTVNQSATAAAHYAKYSEYYSLFDYIVATAAATTEDARVAFILLDFQCIDADNATRLGWRPFLIIQQNLQNPELFTTHSILPGYNDWTIIPTPSFMECGLLCLGVIVLAVVILCSIFLGGIVSAITVRLSEGR